MYVQVNKKLNKAAAIKPWIFSANYPGKMILTSGETGQKFDNPITVPTTYTDRRNRQKTLDALNAKGISSFDPRVTKTLNFLDPSNLVTSFAPQQQKKFGILDLVMIAASGGLLGTKAKTIAQLLGTADRTKNLVSDLSNTFNFKLLKAFKCLLPSHQP